LALVWLTDKALTSGRRRWFAALGAGLALACLLKSSFVLLAAGLATGVVLQFRQRIADLRQPALAGLAGFMVVLLPLAARNVSVGIAPFSLASSGGLNFALSNSVGYRPADGFHVDIPRIADVMGESNGRLLPAAIATLRAHTPTSYLRLLWRKWD